MRKFISLNQFFKHIIILLFVTALFTPPVFGIIMIDEDVEQYTDVNTNNFFEEEIKSHDLQLFNRINNLNAIITIEFKKFKFNLETPLFFISNYLDHFSPPPELT